MTCYFKMRTIDMRYVRSVKKLILFICVAKLLCFYPVAGSQLTPGSDEFIAKLCLLHSEAELFVKNKEWSRARAHFKELLSLGGSEYFGRYTYFDVLVRLANAEICLENYTEAASIIEKLNHLNPPKDFQAKIQFIEARLYNYQNDPQKAYLILKEIKTTAPIDSWPLIEKSFFLGLSGILDQHYDTLFQRAENLYLQQAFKELIPLFQEILIALLIEVYPRWEQHPEKELFLSNIRLLLSKSYMKMKLYRKACELLEKQKPSSEEVYLESLYSLGMCHYFLGNASKAIIQYTSYLKTADRDQLKHYNEVLLLLGNLYYSQEQFDRAKKSYFLLISPKHPTAFSNDARIRLARVFLDEENYFLAEEVLNPENMNLNRKDLLFYEWAYLRGEAYFKQENYSLAIVGYEEALLIPQGETCDWISEGMYNLGWSYLRRAEQVKDKELIAVFLNKAEKYFEALLTDQKESGLYLSLMHVFFLKGILLGDKKANETMDSLINQAYFNSLEDNFEVLLMQARLASDYILAKELFNKLTSSIYSKCPNFAWGWYFRGVNDFTQASKVQEYEERRLLFKEASDGLAHALYLFESENKSLVCQILTMIIKGYIEQDTEQSLLKAKEYLKQRSSLEEEVPGVEERLYFSAVISSKLLKKGAPHTYSLEAISACKKLLDNPVRGKYHEAVLLLLGNNYDEIKHFKAAEEVYVLLANTALDEEFLVEAWFLAGQASRNLREENASSYFKNVYEKFPDSFFAQKAYFNVYTEDEYLKGKRDALAHLKIMREKFPDSPYLVKVYYFLGKSQKDLSHSKLSNGQFLEALELFVNSMNCFEVNFNKKMINPEELQQFLEVYYRALLNKGYLELALADRTDREESVDYLLRAANSFSKILQDFEGSAYSLAHLIREKSAYPLICQEADRAYIDIHSGQSNNALTESSLTTIIEKFKNANICNGYYLSRAWYDLGCLVMNRNDYSQAIDYFDKAEKTFKEKDPNKDYQLDLWIHQSQCYRYLDQFDRSMLILSRIINDEFPSSQKTKAMILRSEIYELQDRYDLAYKQLQVAAAQSGNLAELAKKKD